MDARAVSASARHRAARAIRDGLEDSLGELSEEDLAMLETALARAVVDLGPAPLAQRVVGRLARSARTEAQTRREEVRL